MPCLFAQPGIEYLNPVLEFDEQTFGEPCVL